MEYVKAQPDLSYADYLQLDRILTAQSPRSEGHDELLFIVMHQVMELWMRLSLHELTTAREHIRADELGAASKMITRVARIQQQMIGAWDVLATMTPTEYVDVRAGLGSSSGFQSEQNRLFEFMLGHKNAAAIGHQTTPQARARLAAALEEPSLYDEALRLLHRRGFDLPPEVTARDWREPYTAHEAVTQAWTAIYREPASAWDLYDLAEKLVDLDYRFAQWRFSHLKTVERIIGFKRGSGGTAGTAYLSSIVNLRFFPELLDLRTHL